MSYSDVLLRLAVVFFVGEWIVRFLRAEHGRRRNRRLRRVGVLGRIEAPR